LELQNMKQISQSKSMAIKGDYWHIRSWFSCTVIGAAYGPIPTVYVATVQR